MVQDLRLVTGSENCRVVCSDSRTGKGWQRALGGRLADACLSSPPYLNNFDYADATRIEIYFWGFARTWAEMCSTVRQGMITASTQQASIEKATLAWRTLESMPKTLAAARSLSESLEGERRTHPGHKAYDRVLPIYLADMAAVLDQARRHLYVGAKLALVVGDSAPYGIYVDTPMILAGLASEIGIEFVDQMILRSRGERWRSNGTRHQVPLNERLLIFRRRH
jgi:hypothetical protein